MYYAFFTSLISLLSIGWTHALQLKVPGRGEVDVIVRDSTIEGNGDIVIYYIQMINHYLWIAMVVVAFVVVVWMGFKLMTNPPGSDNAKQVLKDGVYSLGVGIVIVLLSYTIVRLIVNLV